MKRLFSKIELIDMLEVCDVRMSNVLPCRSCKYFLKCEKMYAFLDSIPQREYDLCYKELETWHRRLSKE